VATVIQYFGMGDAKALPETGKKAAAR